MAGTLKVLNGGTWETVGIGGGGNVSAPASAVTDNIASYADTTGRLLKDSGIPAGQVPRKDQINVFTGSRQIFSTGAPQLVLTETAAPANARTFDIVGFAQLLSFRALDDALATVQTTPLTLNRAGDAAIGRDLTVNRALNVASTASMTTPVIVTGPSFGEVRLIDQAGTANNQMVRLLAYQHEFQLWMSNDDTGATTILRLNRQGVLCADRLTLGATVAPYTKGDLVLSRDGLDGSGCVYFGKAQSYYLFCNAGNYTLEGGSLTVLRGNIFTANGYLYPAAVTNPGATQAAWYLASHGSYGLYTNTGLYVTGNVWSNAGFLDYGRGTPMGTFVDFTPTVTYGVLNSNLVCSYMLVGKTMWINFYLNISTNGAVPGFGFYLPAGVTARGYIGTAFVIQGAIIGMAHTTPSGNQLLLYRDQLGTGWPAGQYYVSGCVPIPIN